MESVFFFVSLPSILRLTVGMAKFRNVFMTLIAFSLLLVFSSWDGAQGDLIGPIPPKPLYNDSSQWFIRNRGGAADIFYIISTETGDHLRGNDTCHYADIYNEYLRGRMEHEMYAVDSFYSDKLNYYSPYYRQVSMQSWAKENMAMVRIPLALADVVRSWDYYLEHYNQGRPFILAGFSQGAHALTEILKRMPDSIASRMVAAYAIGYKVTQDDMDQCKHIRPALGATDTGVTICFNSVRSPECEIPIVSGGNMISINPVNWRTDTVSTSFILYGRKRNDTLTVRCDPASRLLIVDGYQEKSVMSVIGRPGNYHNMELKFYYPYIRQNMADRVAAFLKKKK